jgi:hypothetical protein
MIDTIPEENFFPDEMSSKYVLPWEGDEQQEEIEGVPLRIIEEEMEEICAIKSVQPILRSDPNISISILGN